MSFSVEEQLKRLEDSEQYIRKCLARMVKQPWRRELGFTCYEETMSQERKSMRPQLSTIKQNYAIRKPFEWLKVHLDLGAKK